MIDVELFEFNVLFADVRRVFPLRADETETRQILSSYFAAFRRYPLPRVRAGAEYWIAHGKRFPKPVEWIEAMPRPTDHTAPVAELSALEAAEWLEAERGRWEGQACGCPGCRTAKMSERPIRFVPEFDANDQDARGRIGDRAVTRGHWAHGYELARWYLAREAFWSQFRGLVQSRAIQQKKTKRPFTERIEESFKPRIKPIEREPGEDG
jgi:hypothetical protein